jgi:class 3 adenylate cyclase
VVTCPRCGHESPSDFAFCPTCGAALTATAAPREVRKVVTVLFCDLTGSTSLGDRTDPETLRGLMRRYYETARAVLERHGGTVEKFVGDAVMAVFGIPVASEDDALRAVRAAAELRDTVHALGLDARIGINTGEVVAGEGDTLVTGDAVNVAARLEQAAGAGEILLGDETARLVRDAVETDGVLLDLKGKPNAVRAHRLMRLEAFAPGITRRLDRPMVGRARERRRLRGDFDDAVATRTSRLFTLIGPAGVGKSRLVADFLEGLEDATVARGRALSYGEGITYWPLVEILIQLGVDPEAAILTSPADTQLATRAVFERIAEERPLVLVFDDLQWAEPPLFDLIEHVVDWVRDAPIFVLCIGRPELADVRPGWGGGKSNATAVLLEPLGESDASGLADALLDGLDLAADTRARIVEMADGNPLFLEEIAALARETNASADLRVPPTIHAVLQARLDALNDHERSVIERGSVEGKIFHRGSVTALAPQPVQAQVPDDLLALVRKELVRPDRSLISGDDAFRFRHLLIRDTAYESLPKAVRAELHQRFAEWLDQHGDLFEQDEIVGYHFERAAQYQAEVGEDSALLDLLSNEAAERLGRAGRAAGARGDAHASLNLLRRAHDLLPEGPGRRSLVPDLALALETAGDTPGISPLLAELRRGTEANRSTALAIEISIDPSGLGRSTDELVTELEAMRPALVEAGDVMSIVRCDRAIATAEWLACRADRAHAAYRRAFELLRGGHHPSQQMYVAIMTVVTASFAGAAIEDQRSLMHELRRDLEANAGPLMLAAVDAFGMPVEYMAGTATADQVREALLHRSELLLQTGSAGAAQSELGFLPRIAYVEGDLAEYERLIRETVEAWERMGESRVLVNAMAEWALALSRIGDARRALSVVARGRSMGREDDVADQVMLDVAEALAQARLGEADAANLLLVRARTGMAGLVMVMITEEIDRVDAEVHWARGDFPGARAIAERLAAAAEARGWLRWADFHRHRFLAPAGSDPRGS